MPAISYTVTNVVAGTWIVTWAGLASGDTGDPCVCPMFADKSVQVTGTFGTGGAVVVEGTNFVSSPTYNTLNDPQGNALSITAEALKEILENPYAIRPRISSGDGTTALTVRLCVATPSQYAVTLT